jgi:hypothetical protein
VLPVKPVDLRRPFTSKDASVLALVKDEAHPAARWPSPSLTSAARAGNAGGRSGRQGDRS